MAALFRMESGIPYAKVEHAGRVAVESLLMVTVGVLLGRLAWAVLAPADAASGVELAAVSSASSSPEVETAPQLLLTQMNPFGTGAAAYVSGSLPSGETALDLKLSGVRSVPGNTMASSAVISFPDGLQKRFVPGDEVMPGIILVNVTPDAVHFSRSGALETLSLYPGRREPFAPAATEAPETGVLMMASASPEPDVTPSALAADTVMTPEFRSGEVSGYRLEPRGAGAFEAAGLQSGDLILRVNGQAIEGLRPDQINQTVASGADVALDVVRQGAIVRLRVAQSASLSQ